MKTNSAVWARPGGRGAALRPGCFGITTQPAARRPTTKRPTAKRNSGPMRDILELSGPTQKPLAGGRPKQLVVLLHGYGSDGNDLIGLAPHWAPLIPEAEFLAPHAPYPCEMAPFGHQWFSLADDSPAARLAGVRAAATLLRSEE